MQASAKPPMSRLAIKAGSSSAGQAGTEAYGPSMQGWRIALREPAARAARNDFLLPLRLLALLRALTSPCPYFLAYLFLGLLFLSLRFEGQAQTHRLFLDECRRSTGFLDDFFQRFRGAAKLNQPPVVLERPMPFSDHHKNLGSDKAVKRSMFA
jgi:hypothetical protein